MSEEKEIPIKTEAQETSEADSNSPVNDDADVSKQSGEPRQESIVGTVEAKLEALKDGLKEKLEAVGNDERFQKERDRLLRAVTETVETKLEALKDGFKEKLEAVEDDERERYQEERDRLLRTVAEAENAKRRLETQTQRQLKYANETLIEGLVPVLDSLELGLKAVSKTDTGNTDTADVGEITKLSEGMQLVQKQLLDVLKTHGLTRIESRDEMFDPNRHEAIMAIESNEIPAGKVAEEYRCGYLLHERVIRAAQVVVSQGAPEKEEPAQDDKQGEAEEQGGTDSPGADE